MNGAGGAGGLRLPPPLASTAAHVRTRSRFTLNVWVRGKSASGHSRQPEIRWLDPSVALAALTAVSIWRFRSSGAAPSMADVARASRGSPWVPGARTTTSIRPGFVSTATESRIPATRRAFSMSSGYTLNPFGRTIMSFLRPWRWSRPCSSSLPRSPDLYQPSAVNASAVAWGLFQ